MTKINENTIVTGELSAELPAIVTPSDDHLTQQLHKYLVRTNVIFSESEKLIREQVLENLKEIVGSWLRASTPENIAGGAVDGFGRNYYVVIFLILLIQLNHEQIRQISLQNRHACRLSFRRENRFRKGLSFFLLLPPDSLSAFRRSCQID
jgi:poly(A) polymerase Pap1